MSYKRKTAFSEELSRALVAGQRKQVQQARSTVIEQSQQWSAVDIMEADEAPRVTYSIEESSSEPSLYTQLTGLRCTKSRNTQMVTDVLTAKEDVVGDGVTLLKGDLVEVLETKDDAKRPLLETFYDALEDPDLDLGAEATSLLDSSAAKHKLSVRPKRRHGDPRARSQEPESDTRWLVRLVSDPSRCGWVSASSLERRASTCWPAASEADPVARGQDAKFRRDAVVRELVETEEEFGRDMRAVVDKYMVPVDAPSVPRIIRDNKTLVFGNLKEIAEFHNTVLIEGIKYYSGEPRMIGRTFLRLERDFDKHVAYCRDEPLAQEFLVNTPEARDFFEELSQKLGDDKSLSEHLKLPVQRINDYQLLLKELVRYSSRLGEDTTDLSRALELMLGVPHKANDIKFISSIEGYRGNIHKLGRLLRHDWFSISEREGKTKERYLFLFKARILVCKVRRISEDRSVFVLKDIIRLPEVEVQDLPDNPRSFQLYQPTPLTITAHNEQAKEVWLKEIRQYASDVLALAEHAADDLHVESRDEDGLSSKTEEIREEPSKRPKLQVKTEPKPPTPEPIVEEPITPVVELESGIEQVAPTKKKTLESKEENGNGDMSDYLRRSSVRRAGSSRIDVEESYSVSRSSKHESYLESSYSSSLTGSGAGLSSMRSSSRLESSSERYSSGGYGGSTSERYSSSSGALEMSSTRSALGRGSSLESSTETRRALTSGKGKPAFTKTIEGSHLEPGETAVFECSLAGEEKSSVTWLKDNKSLDDKLMDRVSQSSVDNTFKLEIQNVMEEDTGMYIALANNAEGSSTCTAHLLVQKLTEEERRRRAEANAPMFLVKLKDTELLENTYLRFMVKVKGNPAPTVRFYKDDRRILCTNERIQIHDEQSDKGYYELVIPEVKPEDAGKYSCVALNSFGEERCDAQLSVTDEKDVFAGLEEREVEPGEPATFTWTRNGQTFDPEERFKVLLTENNVKNVLEDEEDSLALVFQHVKPEDAGLYTCVAQTSSGKISCSAELTVQEVDMSESGDLDESSGELIDNETGEKKKRKKKKKGKPEGGVNALQKDPEKPKISIESKIQEVSVGGSAMLELKVEGTPKPEISWTKDGVDVKAGGRVRFLYEDDESMSLIIKGVTPEDAGTYTIKAWNDMGEDTAEVQLNVKAPPKFKSKMKDQACMTDETLRVTVEVEGTPAPDISWYKDGKEISASEERFRIVKETSETYTLIIEKVTLGDSGSYSVVARNEVSQTSEFYKLTVQSPPFFTQKISPRKFEMREGDFATFTVKVDGDPKPRVRWLKDGVELKNDDRHVKIETDKDGETHTLTIRGITRDDMGKYTCELDNSNGKATDSVNMFVHCMPQVKQRLKDIIAKEGQLNIVFDVTIEAYPEPEIKWYHDEAEVTERKTLITRTEEQETIYLKTYKLTFKEVQVDQAGTYKCKATNTHGETESASSFTVLYVPKITKQLKDVELNENETLKLNIEANAVPIPDVTWYKDGVKLSAEANANIKISRDRNRQESYDLEYTLIKGQDSGEYECRVTNDQGTSSTKCNVVVSEVVKKTDEEEERLEKKVKVQEEDEEEVEKECEDVVLKKNEENLQAEEKSEKKLKPNEIKRVSVSEEDVKPKQIDEEAVDSVKPQKGVSVSDEGTTECDGGVTQVTIEDMSQPQCHNGVTVKEVDAVFCDDFDQNTLNIYDLGSRMEFGLVEEPADPADARRRNLSVNRGVSIVSFYSDEEDRSRNASPSPSPEPAKHDALAGRVVDSENGGRRQPSVDEEENDPEMEALLRRVQKQRSVLEEILDKEVEKAQMEAKPVVTRHNMQDSEIFESLGKTYEVQCSGHPRPVATWYKDGAEVKNGADIKISESGDLYKLEIPATLIPRDEGVFKLHLENRLGSQDLECNLKLIPVAELRKPVLKEKLKDTTSKKDEEAVLKAVVVGDPVPDIKWWKDGKAILPDQDPNVILNCDTKFIQDDLKECTYTLTIPKGRHSDTGQYSMKATNKYGSVESSATLNILLRPEIEGMKDATGIPTEITQFEVVIKANPAPNVTWMKDDKLVVADDKFEVQVERESEKYRLLIHDTSGEDHGVYTVIAKNSEGEASKRAQLKLHSQAPSFVKDLVDRMIKDSSPVEFKVRANGVPKPKIQWLKDGKEVETDDRIRIETADEGQITSTLSILSVHRADVAKYTCVASNLEGSAETSAMLSMDQAAPMVTIPLEKCMEVNEGEPMELKGKIDGSPVPVAKWYKDGEEISPDDPHIKLTLLPDGTVKLNIDEVKHNDGGAYKVVAMNKNGKMESMCAVAVKPKDRAPVFEKELENVKVSAGQPLKIEATVIGFPPPEVKWLKDGHPIRPSKDISFINDPVGNIGLVIESARPEDAGQYKVDISNKHGAIEGTAKAEVTPRERKPMFHAQLLPTTVLEGFPVQLDVNVVGHPPPTVTWTCNGQEIKPDGKNVKLVSNPDGTHSLIIEKAGPEHAGEYAVTASNDKGSVSSSAPLTVQSKTREGEEEVEPSFVRPPRDTTADEGSVLELGATFLGNPIPDVAWFKDGEPLSPSERVKITCDGKKVGLEIRPTTLGDIGTYTCRLSNPLGEAEAAAQGHVRQVYTPATFVHKFTDTQQIPGLDVKFLARISGNPKPSVSWFIDGKAIQESDKYHMRRDDDHISLTIKNCETKDMGTFTCKIANSAGKDMCYADLEVVDKIEKKQRVEPPSFLKKIGDCEVVAGMSGKFTACINGFPDPEMEWFCNGKRIEPNDRFKIESEGAGLVRLIIKDTEPSDVGIYKLRIFNPHGEASCEAELRYESLDAKPKKPISDLYQDFNKHKRNIPLPLPNAPIISRMSDRQLTLSWRPSIPIGPRFPVTYQVEMCELPDGEWFTVRNNIRSCACEIHNLVPFRNYKFRIRVENKYGVSEPSPYAVTHRDKLEPPPPRFFPYLYPGIDFRPETSPHFPKDFDIEKPPHDGYAQAPRFLRQEHDTQYGVKNHNCNLFWFVYGYPKPKMKYYFNDQEVESGGRFSWSYTRNGQASLFINKMLERDVGTYEAVATNEHGEARQRVKLEIAEWPMFIQRPDPLTVMLRKGGRLQARVVGVPYPEIKWYKDWQPITSSVRVKVSFVEPDLCLLNISDAIMKDEGMYSITASNIAGSVSTSVMVHVEDDERRYFEDSYLRPRPVRSHKEKPITEAYDLGDELGRGTQGVTYHAVERSTGRNFAAKIMHGKGNLRRFMENELEMMSLLHNRRLIRLHDAFETSHTFSLVTELASGGELLDNLSRKSFYTEYEIASYIRQILEGLDHMHGMNIGHLGLNIGDVLVSHPGGNEIKICDFGLARRISSASLQPLLYGMPEFVAPEVVNGAGVGLPADMWSVGIITYLLLTGHSLFRGAHDRETLTRIREGKWQFDEDLFSHYSSEARDFISKLLVYLPGGRINIKQALDHPWFNLLQREQYDPYRMSSDALKNYYNLFKDWYGNASCRNWYRRRPLEGAFTHPSKMVYPPYERYTPEPTPPREPYKSRNWEEEIHGRPDLNYEIGVIKSESHYQNGPDTYLLQLRDVDFPARLRGYMKVAANRGPGLSHLVTDQPHIDWRAPVIRERRRFTDIMDEEIDDERKARISQYGIPDSHSLRRLRHELGTRLDCHAEAEAMLQTRHENEGQLPFFREKPQTIPIVANENVKIACFAVGDPKPLVQWYKCDMVIQESVRISFKEDEAGRSVLCLTPAHNMDIGIYKVVARNRGGQTVARFRVVLAGVPSAPDSPDIADVSDDEVFLRWKQPKDDGNTAVLCYALQYKDVDGDTWIDIAKNIDHEFYVVKNLAQNSRYYFRLAARNRIGWSDFGIPIKAKTKPAGVPKVQVTRAMQHLQSITDSGTEVSVLESSPALDYSIETRPLNWIPEHDVSDKYHFISEISRGRYSVVVKGVEKSNDHIVAGKLLEIQPQREAAVTREFEALRSLRHERIAQLIEAFRAPDSPVAVLILEKLQGADILTYFSSRHEYNEQLVCNVVTQVLDGLQYLHWRGFCHLDLQPDNVVMASVRSVQVKLVDFGSAQRVSKLGTMVDRVGHIEYSSPEMLNDEPVFPQSDMWSLGVLTYILLSGVSPFRGESNEETRQNILFVRYRFEHLYKELSQEATRFLMLVFKRCPSKRPTIEECHEHRWLLPTEYMIKKRERASFLGIRLKNFCDDYHALRARQAINADSLVSSISSESGRRLTLTRSNSITEELDNGLQNGST